MAETNTNPGGNGTPSTPTTPSTPANAGDAREARISAAAALLGSTEPVVDPSVDPAADEAAKAAKKTADDKAAADKLAADKKAADVKAAHEKAAKAAGKTVDQLTDDEKAAAALAVEQPADEDPEALPEEIASNPKVQALKAKAEESQLFRDLLVEGYAIPTETQDGKPRPVTEILQDLRLERSDAHTLYNIVNGQQDAGALLAMLLNQSANQQGQYVANPNLKYPQDVADRVYSQIINFLASPNVKFLQHYITSNGLKIVKADFKAADGSTPETADLGTKTENEQIKNLQGQLNRVLTAEEQRKQNEAAQKTADNQKKVFDSFSAEVERLCGTKQLDPSLVQEYIGEVAKKIAGNPAIIQRISKGNFADVRKLFTEHHNAMLKKAAAYGQKISADKDKINKQVPKTPTGGTPPGSPAPKSRSFKTAEDRLQAVTEMLVSNN